MMHELLHELPDIYHPLHLHQLTFSVIKGLFSMLHDSNRYKVHELYHGTKRQLHLQSPVVFLERRYQPKIDYSSLKL